MPSPAWLAVMVQTPLFWMVMVLPSAPLAVQTAGVVELKVTARPELTVALAVVLPPTLTEFGTKAKERTVWLPLAAVMFWVTCEAAL